MSASRSAAGEFLTLLGPSGSGKTTTLMMVAGFEQPTAGEMLVAGADVARLAPERRNFGVVFQGYALFPHMTVLDNVAFPLRMRGLARASAGGGRWRCSSASVWLSFAARLPRQLSGGQQQRVALARALVFEPDALLLDEPLGALDRKLRESLQVEIKEIQRRMGVSILFVTHDQDEAMTMSDRIAVMADGAIVQIGTPAEVYLHPRTAFVAGFLGETNLLPGTLCGVEDGAALVRFAGGVVGRARLPENCGSAPGRAALVSVRPERIRLGVAEGPVFGRIESCTFLGSHARYLVQALGQQLTVSTPDWSPATALPPGTEVRLAWAAEDAQILEAGA